MLKDKLIYYPRRSQIKIGAGKLVCVLCAAKERRTRID